MSGQPSVEQINKLREVLRTVAKEKAELTQAHSDQRSVEMRISCGEQRLEKAEREVRSLLDAMDCGPNGNAGSEQRMLALLTTLTTLPERAR